MVTVRVYFDVLYITCYIIFITSYLSTRRPIRQNIVLREIGPWRKKLNNVSVFCTWCVSQQLSVGEEEGKGDHLALRLD